MLNKTDSQATTTKDSLADNEDHSDGDNLADKPAVNMKADVTD